ncbi:MAG: regulator [Rhodocyclaceae bacterium]|nr:regulator [Rhodocyclaceae bacterium]
MPIRKVLRLLGTVSVALSIAASTGAIAQSGKPDVLETFNVGQGVYVRSLHLDAGTNTMWVGTSSGVHEIDLATKAPKATYTRDDGLANEYVFAIGTDTEGYKWFGTNAGGASTYKDGKWKTYFPMHGLADYWIYSFANGKDGSLWIGTWAGANQFFPKTGEFKTYVKELINEWVYGLDVDASGKVWFGTEGGLSMFDGKQWQSWTHKDGLGAPNADNRPASTNTGLGTRSRHDLSTLAAGLQTYNPNYCFAVHVDQDQAIWIGTWGGGVSRFDGKTFTSYSVKDGLAGTIVYAITRDHNNVLWFGTSGGVSRFDGKSFQNVTVADGLLDANVYALSVAPDGTIWAGTRNGVARIGTR